MKKFFTEHPNSVNETYFQHLKAALGFSWCFLIAAIACTIHAFFPFLFEHTAGHQLHKLVKSMKKYGRWQKLESLFGPTD